MGNREKQLVHMINEWKVEITKTGTIIDEAKIIQEIKHVKNSQNHELESTLLCLLAQSRSKRLKTMDALTLSWIKRAKELDPFNEGIQQVNLIIISTALHSLLTMLQFPNIRETDNRTTKKKLAEKYISECKLFLDEYVEHLEKINSMELGILDDEAEASIDMLEQLHGFVVLLLKASEEYYDSIIGVFHTSIFLDEIRNCLTEIDNLKKTVMTNQSEQDIQLPDNSLQKLNQMIGLNAVKKRVHQHYRFLEYQEKRKQLGFKMKDEVSLNIVLTGNPGTGKTTLARLLASIYYELHILPKSEVIEVDRSQLVGSYVGQTEENVLKSIKRAIGGVLFIDEAYSLKRDGQTGNDYGQVAIDTIVSAMTSGEYAGKFALILAGYPEEMRQFLWSNPGLRSRFPESNHFHLTDYSNVELLEIGKNIARDNDYILTEEALEELDDRINNERVDETFGNARTVKSIVLDAMFQKGATTTITETVDSFDLTILEKKDLAIGYKNEADQTSQELLDQLVGLHSIKDELKKIQHFVQLQQVRKERGFIAVPIQLHAVFSGNPGTGKTTVAKIYAEMLKECGLLKRGHLVVTSRADLVAGYVGQTAIKTKKKIREALGGLLFIDEAYSLLSTSTSDFGREAIDTIVDEMTKHNENLVIVLAGYPKEIDGLMQSNPGLKSRFKKFFSFADYTNEELVSIIQKRVKQYDYTLTEKAVHVLKEFTSSYLVKGNGRLAVTIVDELIQIQAARIMEQTDIDGSELCLINEKDVEELQSSINP